MKVELVYLVSCIDLCAPTSSIIFTRDSFPGRPSFLGRSSFPSRSSSPQKPLSRHTARDGPGNIRAKPCIVLSNLQKPTCFANHLSYFFAELVKQLHVVVHRDVRPQAAKESRCWPGGAPWAERGCARRLDVGAARINDDAAPDGCVCVAINIAVDSAYCRHVNER